MPPPHLRLMLTTEDTDEEADSARCRQSPHLDDVGTSIHLSRRIATGAVAISVVVCCLYLRSVAPQPSTVSAHHALQLYSESSAEDSDDASAFGEPRQDGWKTSPFLAAAAPVKPAHGHGQDHEEEAWKSSPLFKALTQTATDRTGWYITQHPAIIRKHESLNSSKVTVLPKEALVLVRDTKGNRARIEAPVFGWASFKSSTGIQILRRDPDAPAGAPDMNHYLDLNHNRRITLEQAPDKYELTAETAWIEHKVSQLHDAVQTSLIGSAVGTTANRTAHSTSGAARRSVPTMDLVDLKAAFKQNNNSIAQMITPFLRAQIHKGFGGNNTDDEEVKNKTLEVAKMLIMQEVKEVKSESKDILENVDAQRLQSKMDDMNKQEEAIMYARESAKDQTKA